METDAPSQRARLDPDRRSVPYLGAYMNWLVGLPGLQSDKTLFDGMFSDARFARFSRLALDLVGDDLEEQARGVLHHLDEKGITHFSIVGHSLGGMVGTLLLDRAPDRVRSLVSLEGNLTLEDCGASRTLETPRARSILRWSESGELARIFREAPQPKVLLVGEKSHFRSRPPETVLIPGAGHFLLRDNPEAVYAAVDHFFLESALPSSLKISLNP